MDDEEDPSKGETIMWNVFYLTKGRIGMQL